jgi:hypothetical protein
LSETLNRPGQGAELAGRHAPNVAPTKSIGQAMQIEKNAENVARYLVDTIVILQLSQEIEYIILSRHVNRINEFSICATA